MLIRANGGVSGIKAYLEKGQMRDRFFDRDQLDERKVITGDLDIIDDLSNNFDSNGEKYFHYTLAFKEDNISDDMLKDITQEFRDYYFNSYNDDEVCFYAEAHLPKIKSYKDRSTGEMVERKPHIHVVVSKINLINGHSISFDERSNIKYLDAFQEYVNAKYGLESPKDNPRFDFNSKSESISRYKGDIFTGIGKDHKEKIFHLMLENNTCSMNELKGILEKNGYEVKLRNSQAQSKSYLNITPEGNEKGINLKEFVFSNEFLTLGSDEKLSFIKYKDKVIGSSRNDRLQFIEKIRDANLAYLEAGLPRNIADEHMNLMNEWITHKSDYEKYIDRNGSLRKKYKELTPEEDKVNFIINQRELFYTKNGVENYEPRDTDITRLTSIYTRVAANSLQSAGNDLAVFANDCESISRNTVGPVAKEWRERRGAEYARIVGVSEGGHIRDSINSEGNKRSSTLDTLSIDYINEQIAKDKFKEEVTHLRSTLKADILLELSEKTHGVIPEKYTITSNPKGEDRIKCGENNHSVIDFCRKELNLNMEESIKLLRAAELMQREVDRERGWSAKDQQYLASEYKTWLQEFKANKDKEIENLQKNIRSKFDLIKNDFQEKTNEVKNNKASPYHKRDELRRVLKLERLLENRSLYATRNKELEDIKSKYNLDMQESYRKFLVEKSENGDEKALLELRRLRIDFEEYKKTGSISHVDRYKEFRLNITHTIDNSGTITYSFEGNTILKDVGKRIDLMTTDKDHIKLGFDLAISKFGKNLELHGTDSFRKQMVELAIKNNYDVTFKDSFSENYRKSLVAQMKAENVRLEENNRAFLDKNFTEVHGLLVTKIEKVDLVDPSGKYRESTKITLYDIEKRVEYQLNGGRISHLVSKEKINEGDLISINGKFQQGIVVNPFFWQKYSKDLEQGVLISDFIKDNKIIMELPEWKQVKYSQDYFTINQEGIADRLRACGYEHGDLVSVKSKINLETKSLEYSFEVISDGSFKRQAKKDIIEGDIAVVKAEFATGGNELSKEVVGKIIKYGHGTFKGKESSFILLEENTRRIDPEALLFKEQFCTKHNVALHDLERQSVGMFVSMGSEKFTENAKEATGFIIIKTNAGERKLWGNDLLRVVEERGIEVGNNIYVAKICERDMSAPNDKKPKMLNVYEAEILSDKEMEKASALTAGLYTKYWNEGYKQLIDENKLELGQTMYIAKTSETVEVFDSVNKEFIVEPVNLVAIQSEAQNALENLKIKHDLTAIIKADTGVIVNYGMKKFSETSKEAFYISIVDINCREKDLWGADLERLVKENNLSIGDGILVAKVAETDLGYGRKKAIYDIERLPKLKNTIEQVQTKLNTQSEDLSIKRQATGEIIDFGTRTIKGEKMNFIKIKNDVGKAIPYWDKNIPVDGLKNGAKVFIAQTKETTVQKEIKHDNFQAKAIAQDLDRRAVELTRQREKETQQKQRKQLNNSDDISLK